MVMIESRSANVSSDIDGEHAPHVLIVDDDVVQRELLQRAVKRVGCKVTQAPTRSEAVRLVQSSSFDCVLLDLELGDGDGIDVCRALAKADYSGTVILISGTEAARRSAARSFARSAGIEVQGLPKPVDLASLRISLANLRRDSKKLPAIHAWGGAAVDRTVDEYRVSVRRRFSWDRCFARSR